MATNRGGMVKRPHAPRIWIMTTPTKWILPRGDASTVSLGIESALKLMFNSHSAIIAHGGSVVL